MNAGVRWDEGRSFTYEGVGLPLIVSARNAWMVRREGERTLLTSSAMVVLKGGLLGRLLEPLFRVQFARMGPRTLAAFRHLVECGKISGAALEAAAGRGGLLSQRYLRRSSLPIR